MGRKKRKMADMSLKDEILCNPPGLGNQLGV